MIRRVNDLFFLILLGVTLCIVPSRAVYAGTSVRGETRGEASWYSNAYEGKITASGEAFKLNELTAAHNSLPFGTRVKVTNLSNHKSVIVRINDRMAAHNKRVIDLSYGAARKIGMIKPGIAKVSLVVLP